LNYKSNVIKNTAIVYEEYYLREAAKLIMNKNQIIFVLITVLFLLSSLCIYIFSNQNNRWVAQNIPTNVTFDHPMGQDCNSCHQDQWQEWQNSHHQKSMQRAHEDTVLGNFADVEINIKNEISRFYKKGDEFWVNTENNDYKIEYTFGFEPLQQYLIKMEDGKYQTLPLSWDSRPQERGGQRWFHIYGDDHITSNDRLHWLQPLQNWNGMCADCHSTGLKRNYDPDADIFKTSWDTLNVSCASCHGEDNTMLSKTVDDGLGWILETGKNTMTWEGEKRDQSEIEVCAACHSRRVPLTDGFNAKDRFLDAFSPLPILIPEYYPDGQVRDEDYVWGSFLQSKMFSKGVVCSDCHNPHSLEVKAPDNQLCTQCHLPQHFDTTEHHNHPVGSTGAMCISCHMPNTTYMGVDDRRDHSFRIPRPDLNHKTNSPDACTMCHVDQNPQWAAGQINDWFGADRTKETHYGEILNAVFLGEANAEQKLKKLILDIDVPVIIRGSAYSLLSHYPNENSLKHITEGVLSKEPLIRLGAVKASSFIPLHQRSAILLPLLHDEFKAIRTEVVRILSDINPNQIDSRFRQIYEASKEEYMIAQNQTTWRGEGHFNLALFHTAQNNNDRAENHYLEAIQKDPYFPASYVNLADLFRSQGNDVSDIKTLDLGLSELPNSPDLNYSKALYLIRAKRAPEALDYLKKAVSFAPDNAYYSYVYAVALMDFNQSGKALDVLKSAIEISENDGNLNMMLLNYYAQTGEILEALKYGEKLSKLFPDNEAIQNSIRNLKNMKN
jgi:Tfp pilus assembly protein PilF